jgi:hypothetical protein
MAPLACLYSSTQEDFASGLCTVHEKGADKTIETDVENVRDTEKDRYQMTIQKLRTLESKNYELQKENERLTNCISDLQRTSQENGNSTLEKQLELCIVEKCILEEEIDTLQEDLKIANDAVEEMQIKMELLKDNEYIRQEVDNNLLIKALMALRNSISTLKQPTSINMIQNSCEKCELGCQEKLEETVIALTEKTLNLEDEIKNISEIRPILLEYQGTAAAMENYYSDLQKDLLHETEILHQIVFSLRSRYIKLNNCLQSKQNQYESLLSTMNTVEKQNIRPSNNLAGCVLPVVKDNLVSGKDLSAELKSLFKV